MESIEKAEGPMISRREVGVRKWQRRRTHLAALAVSSANIRPLRGRLAKTSPRTAAPTGTSPDAWQEKSLKPLKPAQVIYSTPSR